MVIAPSMPGFGGSGDLKGAAFSMSGYAKWVADLLDVLEIDEPAVLVGHSFGGGVAIKLAHDMPDARALAGAGQLDRRFGVA